MDFESADPEAMLDDLLGDPALFSRAIVALVAHENFDNRLPSGLTAFLAFFNLHREAIHRGTVSDTELRAAYVGWLVQRPAP